MLENIPIPRGDGIEAYISLVWLFSLIITFLMLLLCYLYLSMRKSREQELLSFTFSNLVIEGLEIERRRISRELHDSVLPLVQGNVVSELIRSICIDLMPPDFTRLSLKDSFAQLCVQFTKNSGIKCACSIDNDLDFSQINAENQLHLYRMVQEAFNNIEKHSKAGSASFVARCYLQNNILICISDDGVGLKKMSKASEGLGMRSIRQRAAITGAKIDFISESGNGLMVRIEVNPSLNLMEASVG